MIDPVVIMFAVTAVAAVSAVLADVRMKRAEAAQPAGAEIVTDRERCEDCAFPIVHGTCGLGCSRE